MKKIIIRALNENGKQALKTHWEESLKMGRVKKLALKKLGFSQIITSEEPFIIEIQAKPGSLFSCAKPNQCMQEIEEALLLNNAVINKDYVIGSL